MHIYLDCIPCALKQALFASRAAVKDEEKIKAVLDRVAMLIPDTPLNVSPAEMGRKIYRIIREITGVQDPYRTLKDESTEKALELYPVLKSMVENSSEPLETAVKVAIAGNIIDFAANPHFELEKEVEEVFRKAPAINHYVLFKDTFHNARNILYLGDNAGETVFDKILIEAMGKAVTYAVRERAIINDATFEDAIKSGLDSVANIISSGCDAPGTILKRCSKAFLEHFENADLIISKGMGNFETLWGEKRPIFYLLKAKCTIVAEHLGVEEGDIVLVSSQG